MFRRSLLCSLSILAIGLITAPKTTCALQINAHYGSSITGNANAAAIEGTIQSAIAAYQAAFADPITVDINFENITSGLGASSTYFYQIDYSAYRTLLGLDATTADDATALGHLPTTTNNPVNGSSRINVSTANLRALHVVNAFSGLGIDGTVYFNSAITNITRPGSNPGKYDLFSVVSHEIFEVLSLGSGLNGLANGAPTPTGAIRPLDLFRYSANGQRSYTTAANAESYFSIDGSEMLVQFNQSDRGDFGDWYSIGNSYIPRVQDAFGTPGAEPNLGVEFRALDVVGYDRILTTPEPATVFAAFVAIPAAVIMLIRKQAARKI
jgi:hypothetical protein